MNVKTRKEFFCRKIIPIFLLCALFSGVLVTALSPQKTYAAQYQFSELSGAVLTDILKDIDSYQNTLAGMDLTATDAAPTQKLIDSARTQIQQAKDTRPPDTADNSVKSAWIASGNQAMAAVDSARTSLFSLQQSGSPSMQTSTNQMEALCNNSDPRCDQNMKDKIAYNKATLAQRGIKAAGGTPATTCNGFRDFFLNPIVCAGRIVASVVSSILISIAAWALAIAGVLFNWAIMNSVILFKDVIFDPIKDGINIGWTAFRDISNIVIIGVFAFIAISIILGNKTFGDKKLVARVLVIAILINFSLLFTQMIIDASNFTAGQFYAATQGDGKNLSQIIDENQPGKNTGLSSGVNPFNGNVYTQVGIAGQFINFLGVTSIADTYVALKDIGNGTDNGWMILVQALFATILLLGAAIVLFYGAFLLISRAIILIFLLLTSAIAFASHLIPKMSDGQFGWKAWWQSLLGSAVLAPLLMIFLYITLVIAGNLTAGTSGNLSSATTASAVRAVAAVGAISQVAGVDTTAPPTGGASAQPRGTLGNLISKSANKGDINALFNYLIVLGLLFGSFKVSSSFASKIGGFNYASMIPAIGVGMASRMAGFVGRQTIGRAGTVIGEGFASRAKAAGPGLRGSMFDMAAQTFKKTGKRDFNMSNTGFGKEIAGMAKLKGAWTGQTKAGGFAGDEKKLKDYFAEKGGRLTHSDDEIKKMAETAATSAATEIGNIGEAKKKLGEDTMKLQGYVDGTKERKDALAKEVEKLNAEEPRTSYDAKVRDAALAEKQSSLHAQDQRIKAAERLMGTYETKSAELDKQEVALKERRNEDIAKALPKGSFAKDKEGNLETDADGNIKLRSKRERLGYNAEEVAHKRITNLPWVLAGQTSGNDRLAKQMRDHVGDKETEKSFKKVIAAITEGNKADERRAKQERKSDAITHAHERVMENVAPQSHSQSNPNADQEPKKDH